LAGPRIYSGAWLANVSDRLLVNRVSSRMCLARMEALASVGSPVARPTETRWLLAAGISPSLTARSILSHTTVKRNFGPAGSFQILLRLLWRGKTFRQTI